MNFTLNRNFNLRTKFGHIISFRKGEPTHVPPVCYEDAIAIGAEPEDPSKVQMPEEITDLPKPPEGMERNRTIREAMLKLEKRNQRGDFTAGGAPHAKVLSGLVGFEVDPRERDQIWRDILVKRAERDDAQTAA
jgi:hypothetical protein